MKLTIKNYEKIKGEWPGVTIDDITETLQYYYFGCHYPNESTIHVVPLQRDGVNLYNYANVFYFVGPDGDNSQGVTTDWFSDMLNAVGTVRDEFIKRYNHNKINTTI
jgi:hypothetical protein